MGVECTCQANLKGSLREKSEEVHALVRLLNRHLAMCMYCMLVSSLAVLVAIAVLSTQMKIWFPERSIPIIELIKDPVQVKYLMIPVSVIIGIAVFESLRIKLVTPIVQEIQKKKAVDSEYGEVLKAIKPQHEADIALLEKLIASRG